MIPHKMGDKCVIPLPLKLAYFVRTERLQSHQVLKTEWLTVSWKSSNVKAGKPSEISSSLLFLAIPINLWIEHIIKFNM